MVTGIGAMLLNTPVAAMVRVAELPLEGSAPGTSDTEMLPLPVPEDGETWSHDAEDETDHVTVPVPACVSRIACAPVRTCELPPITPKFSDERSGVSDALTGPSEFAYTGVEASLRRPSAS